MGIPVGEMLHTKNDKHQQPTPYMDDDVSLQLPCTNDSQQPLTVLVRHHVLRNKLTEFMKWCKEINDIVRTYDGFIGAEIIKPVVGGEDNTNGGGDSNNEVNTTTTTTTTTTTDPSNSSRRSRRNSSNSTNTNDSDEYISIVRFQNYTALKKWMDSDDRKRMLHRSTQEFTNIPSKYSYHSLEHWFPSSSSSSSDNITTTNNPTTTTPKKGGPPPKWKMTIFVTINIYLQTLWIPIVTNAIFTNKPNKYAIGLLNTFIIVILVTYIVFPITTRLLAFWLFPNDKYIDKLKELIPSSSSSSSSSSIVSLGNITQLFHRHKNNNKEQKQLEDKNTTIRVN